MQRWDAPNQIVSRDDELERELRVHFLIARRHVLDRRDDRLKLFFGFPELVAGFYDLLERCDLRLWLPCLVESIEQFVSLRHAFAANLNGFGLFCRDRKNAACLERLLGRLPPAFPFRLSENITHKPLTDLLRRGFTVQAFKNIADQGSWILLLPNF